MAVCARDRQMTKPKPAFRITYPDPGHLRYEDDQLTLDLERERSARGMFVRLHDLPAFMPMTREELARRIRLKVERWGFKVEFHERDGHQIEPTPECSVIFRDLETLDCKDDQGRTKAFRMEFVIRPKYGIVVAMDDADLARKIRALIENRRFRVDFVGMNGNVVAPRR